MLEKITQEQMDQHGVVSAPDRLTGNPADVKAVFDRLVKDLVAQVVNNIIDAHNGLDKDVNERIDDVIEELKKISEINAENLGSQNIALDKPGEDALATAYGLTNVLPMVYDALKALSPLGKNVSYLADTDTFLTADTAEMFGLDKTAVPDDVLAAIAQAYKVKTYVDLSQLGLSGAVTMAQVCEKMPNGSMLVYGNTATASNCVKAEEVPHTLGTVVVMRAKANMRLALFVRSDATGLYLYAGKYHASEGGWTGWKRVADTDYALNKGGDTMTGELTIQKSDARLNLYRTSGKGSALQQYVNALTISVYNDQGSTRNYRRIKIQDSDDQPDVGSAVVFQDVVEGKKTDYPFLHTGNLEALGIARVVTGSYVGTGEKGAAHPNIITTPFRPKFVLVLKEGADIYNGFDSENCHVFIDGLTGLHVTNDYGVNSHVTFSDTGVSWYHTGTSTIGVYQLNSQGVSYHYIAIG